MESHHTPSPPAHTGGGWVSESRPSFLVSDLFEYAFAAPIDWSDPTVKNRATQTPCSMRCELLELLPVRVRYSSKCIKHRMIGGDLPQASCSRMFGGLCLPNLANARVPFRASLGAEELVAPQIIKSTTGGSAFLGARCVGVHAGVHTKMTMIYMPTVGHARVVR